MPAAIDQLLDIMRQLRDPETGCPWDREQTFDTIAPYTIEEAYEVADAIRRGDHPGLRAELGDLLLQVVYHARIAEEQGLFDFNDVAQSIADKMVRRHPHVFGSGAPAERFTEVDWDRQKQRERAGSPGPRRSALDGAADASAPVHRAVTLGQRAARVGFDWPNREGVYEKIEEELTELRDADDSAKRTEEFGDLLFALMNLARHLQIDPEAALRDANEKFEQRFRAMEQALDAQGLKMSEQELTTLEDCWQSAKRSPTDGAG